jgi:hypothetical protein
VSGDVRELLAAVRAWAAANYPGCPLEFVAVHLRYLPVPIQLADAPGAAAAAARPNDNDEEEGRGKSGVDACTADVLAALRAVGRPLTKTRLLEEMAARARRRESGEWSESTVCRRLANLMEDGTIENPEGARPRGYRLAAE